MWIEGINGWANLDTARNIRFESKSKSIYDGHDYEVYVDDLLISKGLTFGEAKEVATSIAHGLAGYAVNESETSHRYYEFIFNQDEIKETLDAYRYEQEHK